MLRRLFGRSPQPRSTRAMIRALRAAAQFADAPDEQREYVAAADALDRVLTAAERHSDAPTRDAFSYALGRAELDLDDKLTELIEVSKETHMIVQIVQGAQSSQEAAAGALWAAFQSFSESLTQWREEIEQWRGLVDAALASFTQSRAQSIDERQQLRNDMEESKAHRARMQQTLDVQLPAISAAIRALDTRHGGQIATLNAQLQEIQRLLEIAGSHEAGG